VNTNFDQDHIADLPAVRQVGIRTFYRNKSVTPESLQRIKQANGRVTREMESLIDMKRTYSGPASPPPVFDSFTYRFFHAAHPDDFDDTNNLSVATIVTSGACSVLVPGDLETPGWEFLLRNPEFRAALASVRGLVASHHGRESGCCEELFRYCSPAVVLISDEHKSFETQDTTDWYAARASGIQYGDEIRRVLSTRCDGRIALTF
jgi:beta-lactamase superfamily II metal-dependent hydrolase